MKNIGIILASGNGERSGLNIPKQFYKIKNKTILEYAIEAFENNNLIDEILLVSNPLFLNKVKEIINTNNYKKIINVLPGGKTRQESSYIGVFSIEYKDANVLIHDAARPFVSQKIISDCVKALEKYNAVNVGIDSSDTIIEIDENNFIKQVPNRKTIKRCQTPQCFKLSLIKKAHKLALENRIPDITDDCSLILKQNLSDVYVVQGDENNIKITYPSDIIIAENMLS